jgi:hypothetical protein
VDGLSRPIAGSCPPSAGGEQAQYLCRVSKTVVATWDRHVTALIDGRAQRKMVPILSAGGDFL